MTAISGISSSNSSMQTWQAMIQQRKQDFSQLASAIQSGNLTAAQSAFSTLQGLSSQGQSSTVSPSGNSSSASSSGNTISNDFAALGQALQSGNITNAQSAFAQLQTDMQAQQSSGHHHHHHHHGGAGASGSSTNGQNTVSSTSLPNNSTLSISA
jgi:hypothetical protein